MKNTLIGLSGQVAFEMLLSKLKIPRDFNNPLLDERLEKDYDFSIPKVGKIEIKTIHQYCRKIIVKISEWHHNDFLIAWQFNKEETSLRMVGWLTRERVEAYPKTPRGDTVFNPYSEAYIIDISDLEPPNTFIDKLQKIT